ncbi:MAG: helix-turn-helix transcriptional regulator [Acidobacteriaceae bacterium]
MEAYLDHYSSVNVLSPLCDRLFPDGTVRYSHIAVPDNEFEKTEFYNDYFRPGGYFYSFGIKVPLPGGKPAYLASLRPKEKGPYGDAEGAVLTTLLPHLQRGLLLHFQFSLLRSGLQATLDHLPYGLALLDARGRCVLLNNAAKQILDKRDGLVLSKSRLVAESPAESARLRAAIARAVDPAAIRISNGGGALLVSRRSGISLQLIVSPFVSGLVGVPLSVAATVYIRDSQAKIARPIDTFQSLYGLTKAEAKLATLLVEGCNISDAAEKNRVTRETVRSQLKAVFQKTGTRRQAELVRLLAAIPAK